MSSLSLAKIKSPVIASDVNDGPKAAPIYEYGPRSRLVTLTKLPLLL